MEGVGPEAPKAPEAVLGVGPGGGDPSRKGVRGYHPRENFRNLTTLMCILETEISLLCCMYTVKFNTAQKRTSLKFTLEYSQISTSSVT
jgi:hypothetical protein